MAKKNEFICGYVCAVANLLRERDAPVFADGLLESINIKSVKELKLNGVAAEDISILKKYKLIN